MHFFFLTRCYCLMQVALLVDGDVVTEAVAETRENAERRAARKAIELFKVILPL